MGAVEIIENEVSTKELSSIYAEGLKHKWQASICSR